MKYDPCHTVKIISCKFQENQMKTEEDLAAMKFVDRTVSMGFNPSQPQQVKTLLTHFILNELFCHIYWKSPFSI